MDTPEQLEARLRAGGDAAWLTPGEVAAVLRVSRKTADRLVTAGVLAYRVKPGSGGHRLCDPTDVLELLKQAGEVRRGGDTQPPVA